MAEDALSNLQTQPISLPNAQCVQATQSGRWQACAQNVSMHGEMLLYITDNREMAMHGAASKLFLQSGGYLAYASRDGWRLLLDQQMDVQGMEGYGSCAGRGD